MQEKIGYARCSAEEQDLLEVGVPAHSFTPLRLRTRAGKAAATATERLEGRALKLPAAQQTLHTVAALAEVSRQTVYRVLGCSAEAIA